MWSFGVSDAFRLLVAARLLAAFFSNISDCDETFNYWEPTHYLMYGTGFQTWEYSPVFAVRSYAYLLMHTIPGEIIRLLTDNKIAIFYGVRCCLGVVSALCETYLYRSVLPVFGRSVARLLLAFLLFGSGMFISSTAYLPSSFSMYCVMVSTGAWLSGNLPLAVFAIAMATIIGWPFAAALGLPLAVDIIVCKKDVWGFIRWSCLSAVATLVPTAVIDYYFYRKFVVASMNIVLYNVFGKGGPELYGVEPWTYYFVNGFLNFNIVFLLGMMSAVIWVIHLVSVRRQKSVSDGVTSASWKCLAPLYIWIAIFFTRPHKEERFLFPVYPLICLAAAVSLHNLLEVLDKVGRAWQLLRPFLSSLRVVKYAVVTMFVLLSISRSLALFKGYHAPLELYGQLYKHTQTTQLSQNRPYNVCIGKEWYRFTSNFFVHSDRIQVQFIRSSFRGQLPKHYGHATWIMPSEMNDMNREEPGRYVDVSKCQYIVDWDNRAASVDEPNYSLATTEWKVVASAPFLDAGRSSSLYRAFYVPGLSEDTTVYGSYNLLQQITAQ